MNKYVEQMHKSLLELVGINSVEDKPQENAPFGLGARKALDYTLALCKSLGFETLDDDGYCGHAEIGEGELFGILTHLDTVPIDDGWKHNPLGEMKNGYLYGRGVVDDKGPLIACLYATRALLDEGYTPKKKLRFIFGCNEETGWNCVNHYFSKYPKPTEAFSPDGNFPVINCEKGVCYYHITLQKPAFLLDISGGAAPNMVPNAAYFTIAKEGAAFEALFDNLIDVAHIEDDENLTIRFEGIASHGSTPNKGENAIVKMLRVLSGICPEVFLPVYDRLNDYEGKSMGINYKDEESGALTMNVGTIKLIGDKLEIVVDVRHPISTTKEALLKEFQDKLPSCEVKTGHFHLPLYVSKDSKLVVNLLSAYNDVTGESAEPIIIGGGTYARILSNAVAFGPEFDGIDYHIHDKDEGMSMSDFYKMAKIYKEAIKRLCFEKR